MFWFLWLIAASLGAAELSPEEIERNGRHLVAHDLSRAPMRPTVPGAYRSPLGIQIHPSCFKYFSEETKEKDRAHMEKLAERWIQGTVGDVFGSVYGCAARYPEAKQYFQDWAGKFRRTVVTCSTHDSKKIRASAYHCTVPEHLTDPTHRGSDHPLSQEEIAGISISKGKSMAKEFKTVVVLPRDTLTEAFLQTGGTDGRRNASDTLIHEVFHSTGANNRQDHNEIERKKPETDAQLCEDNVGVDRVNLLSVLCSDDRRWLGQNSTFELLAKRMKKCGAKKGCVDTFTQRDAALDEYVPSYGLPESAARGFCEQMAERVACEEFATKLRTSDPRLKELDRAGERMKARLDEILPRSHNEIPAGLLKATGLQGGFHSLQATDCFQAAFERDPAGGMRLKNTGEGQPLPPYARARFYISILWANFEYEVKTRLDAKDSKCQEPYRSQILKLAGELQQKVESAFSSNAHLSAAAPRFEGKPEHSIIFEDTAHRPLRQTDSFKSPRAKTYEALIGADVYNDYFHALETAHPVSAQFNCVNAGFHPKATIDLARGSLAIVNRAAGPACMR